MKRIGVLCGSHDAFPQALIDRIDSKRPPGLHAEHVKVGSVPMDVASIYDVILDRISHEIPFYRAYLKNAVLHGSVVMNNPFWLSADDKFFNYSIAAKLEVATPKTVLLPHKHHPPGTSTGSLRNLKYPLDWDYIFHYIGFPAYLKPHTGTGWKNVERVHNPQEFFAAYDRSGDLCMVLQEAIEFDDYFRCFVVGQQRVHVMRYDPRRPVHERYLRNSFSSDPGVHFQIVSDCLKLCRTLGYDLNTVEWAVRGGVPYAIDFLNPAPDTDIHSIGRENFEWIVESVADLAIYAAETGMSPYHEMRWQSFLQGAAPAGA